MPQMAPMMWLYLLIMFLLSLMLFMFLNHFIKPTQIPYEMKSTPNLTNNKPWKL